MFKMYIKTAFRNLLKQKYFSLINILGLSFGIAASVMIYLWVNHESGFDKFHKNYQNIYRLTADASLGGQKVSLCYVPSPMAKEMIDKSPEVTLATRITPYFDVVYQYNNNFYKEKKAISADSNFFKMFSFTFIEGNPEKPYPSQNSVVLTRKTANKYFGNEPAVGKVLLFNGRDPYTISGVIEDLPSSSHLQFSMAIYLGEDNNWGNFNRMTYIMVKDNFSKKNIDNTLNDIETKVIKVLASDFGMTTEQMYNSGNYLYLDIQPVASIHLNSNLYGELEPAGNKTIVLLFSIIAILILVIASINYTNLSTAYYDNRRMEVGIRKANGATRSRLVWQFLVESLLISLIAFFISMVLIRIFLPLFKNYIGLNVEEGLYGHWYFTLCVFALVVLVGFVSGLYPAAYLSQFKTIAALKNKTTSKLTKLFNVRSALVIFQFVITIFVIVATVLIKKQVDFLLNKDIGFNKEKLVVLQGANNLGTNKEVFKNELKQNPLIANLCYSDVYPGEMYQSITGYSVEGYTSDQQFVLKTIQADADYFDTYQMKIVQGRAFNNTDKPSMILNEKAVEILKLNDPLHSKIMYSGAPFPLVGVVKNFNHDPLNISLDPIIIRLTDIQYYDYATIRLSEGDTREAMQFIADKWNKLSGNRPLEYFFLDSKIESAYKAEMKAGDVFSAFSVLSVIIACMGLFGIASFIIQRRVKEIGIRKVNGAKVAEILALLSKDFVIWVIIAFVIATPVAWFAMTKWLESFAFKTDISWWIFALSGLIALIIALVTVSLQSWKAATHNPVEALRYE
jgi:putative ABC transport system permease protein